MAIKRSSLAALLGGGTPSPAKAAEAKGRRELAAALGQDVAHGRMSVARARDLLRASPKASSLSNKMAGRDQAPGADAVSQASSFTAEEQGLLATANSMKSRRRR